MADRLRIEIHDPKMGLAVYPPGASLRIRKMSVYEFVWIIDGEVIWHCDGQEHLAPPGTVILERPGMKTGYLWDPRRQTRHAYFHFSILTKKQDMLAESDWPRIAKMPEGDIIRPLFRQIAALADQASGHAGDLLESAVCHMLESYVSNSVHTRGEGGTRLPEAVERAMSFVAQKWKTGRLRPFTLDELAKASSVSPGHLCRLFQGSFGHGPIEVLRLLRLDRAGSILARTNMRIQEVAEVAGFENAFHFSRAFKVVFGKSPREFRKKVEHGELGDVPGLGPTALLRGRLWGSF